MPTPKRITKTKKLTNPWPKCPKCKSHNVEIIEIWDATISWYPGDANFNDGAFTPGDPQHVEGNCQDCDYRWRMRGIVQVDKRWFKDG